MARLAQSVERKAHSPVARGLESHGGVVELQ